jgi:hypothetical protein
MSGPADALFSLLGVGVFLLVMVPLQVVLAVGLGRRPTRRFISWIASDYDHLVPRRRISVAVCIALVLGLQVFPLSQENVFGGSQPPNHILGVSVIVIEIALAILIWRGTRGGDPT